MEFHETWSTVLSGFVMINMADTAKDVFHCHEDCRKFLLKELKLLQIVIFQIVFITF